MFPSPFSFSFDSRSTCRAKEIPPRVPESKPKIMSIFITATVSSEALLIIGGEGESRKKTRVGACDGTAPPLRPQRTIWFSIRRRRARWNLQGVLQKRSPLIIPRWEHLYPGEKETFELYSIASCTDDWLDVYTRYFRRGDTNIFIYPTRKY